MLKKERKNIFIYKVHTVHVETKIFVLFSWRITQKYIIKLLKQQPFTQIDTLQLWEEISIPLTNKKQQ